MFPPAHRGGAATVALQPTDLAVAHNDFITILGPSGCGKSTLLRIVAGLDTPTSGRVLMDGHPVGGPGPDRGMVFQSPCLLPWMTAVENVLLGVEQVYPQARPQERRDIVEHYLGVVGLGDSMHRKPDELSQGMRQRVGIARAFALTPNMLLHDEPYGMLDHLTRFENQQELI